MTVFHTAYDRFRLLYGDVKYGRILFGSEHNVLNCSLMPREVWTKIKLEKEKPELKRRPQIESKESYGRERQLVNRPGPVIYYKKSSIWGSRISGVQ